ncbi:MAG TPA: hypothetical protein VMM55_14145, partial [Thermohalobaculum sp.]|nr:hypothetical protein [Thermohalobaculum sp.]
MRAAAAALAALLALPLPAPAADDLAEARQLLLAAETALGAARSGEARLSAIGRAIHAQEAALAAIRHALRRLHAEQAEITRSLHQQEDHFGQVLTALQARAGAPASALLAFPADPLDAARAAAMLGDVTPVIRERMDRLADRARRLETRAARQREAEREARLALAAL